VPVYAQAAFPPCAGVVQEAAVVLASAVTQLGAEHDPVHEH
jgi:hypothetical protein